MVRVVIPEDTETARSLWEGSKKNNTVPDIFPGFMDDPRGISGTLDEDPALCEGKDMLAVVLSNGWTVCVPKGHVRRLS